MVLVIMSRHTDPNLRLMFIHHIKWQKRMAIIQCSLKDVD